MDVEEGEQEQEQGEDAVEDGGAEIDEDDEADEDEDYERTAFAVGAEFILHRVLVEADGLARWTTCSSTER